MNERSALSMQGGANPKETTMFDGQKTEATIDASLFNLTTATGWAALEVAWRRAWSLENAGGPEDSVDHGSSELEDKALSAPAIDWPALSLKLEMLRDYPGGSLNAETWPIFEDDIRRLVGREDVGRSLVCPVESLARELASVIRARKELNAHGEASETTVGEERFSTSYLDQVLCDRYSASGQPSGVTTGNEHPDGSRAASALERV
jgi:hypothetical protein